MAQSGMNASADSVHDDDFHHGAMPITEQRTTFQKIMGLIKWISLALACLLTWLILWFCTPAGFFPGVVVAVIMAAIGTFVLTRKPSAH